MAKKKIKTRLGNDGYDYPYTSTDLVKDNEGKSVTVKFEEVNEQYNTINAKFENGEIGTTLKNIEPNYQDIPKLSFIGDTSTMTKENKVVLQFNYVSQTANYCGYAETKWQGSSSLSYDKKNYTIKLYKDSEKTKKLKLDFKSWGEQNKFVLKANYIDTLHVRNIVCARLASDIMKNRSDFDSLPIQLQTAPNNGYIDGFPVEVFINGEYAGLYTMNIPKDRWCYNLDENDPNNCLLMAEKNNDGNNSTTDNLVLACEFRTNATIFADTSTAQYPAYDWVIEVGNADGEINSELRTSFNNLINVVKDTTDEEFKTQLPIYLDLTTALDYYIFVYLFCDVDGLAKNMGILTYDGMKWFPILYDLDSTFGSNVNGSAFVSSSFACPEQYQETNSLLWRRIENCFGTELYNRYTELRNSVLSLGNIFGRIEEFCDVIPDKKYTRDRTKWTSLPSVSSNTVDRLESFIRDRANYVDGEMAKLGVESIPCTNISLNTNALTFKDNTAQTLTTTVTPVNTTDNVVWSVSPTGICSVNNGVVTPIANGTCTITVICGSRSATCNVNVNITETSSSLKLTKNIGFNNNDGSLKSVENCWALEEYYPVTALNTYDITCENVWLCVFGYDENKNYVNRLSDGSDVDKNVSVVIPNTVSYIRWGCYGTDGDGTTSVITNETDIPDIPDLPLKVSVNSSTLSSDSTVWNDTSGNNNNFTITGTPDINENGLLMTSASVKGDTDIQIVDKFIVECTFTVMTTVSGIAVYSVNKDNSTEYCDSLSNGTYRINGYHGDTNTSCLYDINKELTVKVVYNGDNVDIYKNDTYIASYTGAFSPNSTYKIVLGASSYNNYPINLSNFRIKEFKLWA